MAPTHSLFASQVAPHANLRRIFVLRIFAISGQCLTVLWVEYGLHIPLPLPWMILIIGLLAGFNLFTWWRLDLDLPITDIEVFGQLLVDVAMLTGLLYFSGGPANPFISLYLLPLIIVAITLPRYYAWLMAVLTTACYSVLMSWHEPVLVLQDPQSSFHLHLLGMWCNFVLSAGLIVFFVVRMAATIRERDRLLAASREDNLRNEQVVALGTQAAGAAHELGTPLATMAVITRELQNEYGRDPNLTDDLQCLRDQVDICKQSLARMLARPETTAAPGPQPDDLDAYLEAVLDKCRLLWPMTPIVSRSTGRPPAPRVEVDETLGQTLTTLCNNAVDGSPDGVEVVWDWGERECVIEILDRGPGITPAVADAASEAFFTTKGPHGLGLGLFLAHVSVERLGGQVRLLNREGGGARTQLTLPIVPAPVMA